MATETPDAGVALLGTMDTKGAEYAFVRDRLADLGLPSIVIDAGVLGEPLLRPDVTRDAVAAAAGDDVADLARGADRGAAVTRMADGAAAVLASLEREGRLLGALALGGTGGTSIAARAFRELPIGLPKLIVSTVAAGDTAPYIGSSDLVLMPSLVDIAGVNRVSSIVFSRAAAALAGMIADRRRTASPEPVDARSTIAASMFGVTTPCVDAARARLDDAGSEVLVFHMTGVGGRTMERLIREGLVDGVLDVTTTELADELVGGVFSAGPERLTAAAASGIPQVVSVGALDMVNFGPADSVPPRFAERRFLMHNPTVTLMRTTVEECAELGRRLAERVSASTAPATVVLPLRGVSSVSVEGGPFHDPAADRALFDAVRSGLAGSDVELVELDTHINDPVFAETMVDRLTRYPATTT